MADRDAVKKWRPWGLIRDAVISTAIALGLDAWVKDWVKDLFTKHVGPIAGEAVKQKFEDKRADMLREFRKMNDAGINLDNLWRRHGESIAKLHEDHFVELLCKISACGPGDPSTEKPPVSPGVPGKPANDRQADILWMNNMTDERFQQAMYFLDHDVVTQFCQRFWRQFARICKKIWGDLKNAIVVALAGMGIAGVAILGALRVLYHGIARFARWASGNLFRIAIVVIIAAIIFWPLALVALMILKAFHSLRGGSNQNVASQRSGIGLLGFIGVLVGIPLLMGIYFRLIPTWNDPGLIPVLLMVLAATFCFWRVRWLRTGLFALVAILTIIFSFGGRTAFGNVISDRWNSMQKIVHTQEQSAVNKQTQMDEQKQKPSPGQPADTGSPKKIEEPVKSPRQTDSSSQEGLEEKGSGVAEGQVVPQTTPAPTPDPNAAPVQVAAVVGDLDIVVQNCVHRLNKFITCDAIFTSVEGNPKELAMKEGGAATDNESNVVPLPLNWITSDLGWNVVLKHGDSAKFGIKFKDDSFGESNRIMIKFHLRWNGDYGDIEMPQSVRVS